MNKFMFFSAVVVSLSLTGAASAQSRIYGAEFTTDASQCDPSTGECVSVALQECNMRAEALGKDLLVSQTGAASALANYQNCRSDLAGAIRKPATAKKAVAPVPPPAPPPKVCVPDKFCRIENSKPKCGMNSDGTGKENPDLVPVPYGSSANTYVCVTGPEAANTIATMKNRVDALCGDTAADTAKCAEVRAYVDQMTELVGKPQEFAAKWNEVWVWYQKEKETLAEVDRLVRSLKGELGQAFPPIPDKPNASMHERIEYKFSQVRGSRIAVRPFARGEARFVPGAGAMPAYMGGVELEVAVPNSSVSLIASGALGGTGNSATGSQLLVHGNAGVRFYLDDNRQTSLDVTGYVQSVRSIHSAGYQNDTLKTSGMGQGGGLELGAGYCFGSGAAFCLRGGGYVGGGGYNSFPGPYQLNSTGGVEGGLFLEAGGNIPLF